MVPLTEGSTCSSRTASSRACGASAIKCWRRIPDDGEVHFLPPGLGTFPLKHVDDFGTRVPSPWVTHGGVLLPMYQSEV